MPDVNHLHELSGQIHHTVAWRVGNRIEVLDQSQWMFGRNMAELRGALIAINDQKLLTHLWTVENRPQLRQYQLDVVWRLQNALTSCSAVVKHAETLARDYVQLAPDVLHSFNQRRHPLVESPLFCFFEFLRGHALHVAHHITTAEFRVGNHGATGRILLGVAGLKTQLGGPRSRRRRGKPSPSERAAMFLSTAEDTLDLLPLVDQLEASVNELLTGFRSAQFAIYERHLPELEALQAQMRKELGESE